MGVPVPSKEVTTPTADETCTLLAGLLRDREPFTYTRFGDGDIQFMFGLRDGRTADGEICTPELKRRLRQAWATLGSHHRSLIGDFRSCIDFGKQSEMAHFAQWEVMLSWSGAQPYEGAARPALVHIEAPLMWRLSDPLYRLYAAIRDDERPKLLVAPARLSGACRMLDCGQHEVPLSNAWERADDLIYYLDRQPEEVLLFCAGRASKVVMAGLVARKPDRTYIDLGSGLDPLFVGHTRGHQVPRAAAAIHFAGLFGCREQAIANLKDFARWAAAAQIPFTLMDGTLLGAIRDRDFCRGDENDIDVAVMDRDWERLMCLFPPHGFTISDRFEYRGQTEGLKFKRGASHFDVVRMHRHPQRSEVYNYGRRNDGQQIRVLAFVVPAWHYLNPPEEILFHGVKVRVPAGAESLLTERYGDWRTPINADVFDWYTQSNRESIMEDYDRL